MGQTGTDEFRKDACAKRWVPGIKFPEDGLTRKQIASDPGVGMSTLNKRITAQPSPGNGLQGKP